MNSAVSFDHTRRAPYSQSDVSIAVLVMTLMAAPLMLGGHPWWSIALLFVLSQISLWSVVASGDAHLDELRLSTQSLLFTFFLASAWTALQLVPLPIEVTRVVAPHSAKLCREVAAFRQTSAVFCAISVAPHETLIELTKWLTLLSLFAATALAVRNRLRLLVARYLAAACIALALFAVLHEALEAERVFGLYLPRYASPRLLSPVLNGNHFASIMVLGVCICIGLSAAEKALVLRTLFGLGALTMAVLCVISGSRAGIASLAAGGGFLLLRMLLKQLPTGQASLKSLSMVAGVAAFILGGFAWVMSEGLRQAFQGHSWTEKPQLIWDAAKVSLLQPATGIGRGAFASLFTSLHGSAFFYTYPENLVVQWASEWGLPFTLAFLALLLFHLLPAVTHRHPLRAAGATGVLAMGLHDLGDFSLELVGAGALAVAAIGLTSEASRRENHPTLLRLIAHVAPREKAFAVCSTLGTVAVTLVSFFSSTQAVKRSIATSNEDHRGAKVKLLQWLPWHPVDAHYHLIAFRHLDSEGSNEALPWLNRAVRLAPGWASSRLLQARWFFQRGNALQGATALRTAALLNPSAAGSYACELFQQQPRAAILQVSIPDAREQRHTYLRAVAKCTDKRNLGRKIDQLLIAQRTNTPAPYRRELKNALSEGRQRQLVRNGLVWLKQFPDDLTLAYGLSRAAELEGPRAAETVLANVSEASPKTLAFLLLRAKLFGFLKRYDEMQEQLQQIPHVAKGDIDTLASANLRAGDIEAQHGFYFRALQKYQRSHDLDERPVSLYKAARVAKQLGAPDFADMQSRLCAYTTLQAKAWCEDLRD